MTEVLTKPIRRKTLLAALHKWLPGKPDLEESAIQANVVAPSAAVELPQVHGVNVAEAVARLGLPWIMLKAILGKLATALPERLAEVRRALDANDLEEARRHAHSIAGAAGSAGAMKVHVRAKTLEKAVKDDQPANLEKLFSALSEELDIIVFSIGKLD